MKHVYKNNSDTGILQFPRTVCDHLSAFGVDLDRHKQFCFLVELHAFCLQKLIFTHWTELSSTFGKNSWI